MKTNYLLPRRLVTDRRSDNEQLQPIGEATQIPDGKLSNSKSGESHRQQLNDIEAGYPDSTKDTERKCESCGASVPAGQTKCRFCLSNHLDASDTDKSSTDTEWTFLHVVHLVVEASTDYSALAKGAAAATLLAKPDRDPAVDSCQPIYSLAEGPAPQLAEKWPSLPAATPVTSKQGVQLLAAACERTMWTDTAQPRHDGEHATFLYDEAGSGIHNENRLTALLESASDDIWLVPAMALQRSTEETTTEDARRTLPNSEHLECRNCNRETQHHFDSTEDVPDDEWADQPIWECQTCGAHRYGPSPDAEQ